MFHKYRNLLIISILIFVSLFFVGSDLAYAGQTEALPSTPCGATLTGGNAGYNNEGECMVVSTAIGTISTSPTSIITYLLRALLSIAGLITTFLIIRAGYGVISSQGNPEKLQESREQLIGAITGLLFIVFSFVLLDFIMNRILDLNF